MLNIKNYINNILFVIIVFFVIFLVGCDKLIIKNDLIDSKNDSQGQTFDLKYSKSFEYGATNILDFVNYIPIVIGYNIDCEELQLDKKLCEQYTEYVLLKINDDNIIDIEQINSSFDFISNTSFTSKQNKIHIDQNSIPFVIKMTNYHIIKNSLYEYYSYNGHYEGETIGFTKIINAPRFFEIQTINNDKIFTEKIDIVGSIISQKDNKEIYMYHTMVNPVEIIDNDVNISLIGFDKSNKPSINTTIKGGDEKLIIKGYRSGNNYIITTTNLDKNKKYKLEINYNEKNINYNYIIDFGTLDDFRLNSFLQNKLDNGELTNEISMCFSNNIDYKNLESVMRDAFGIGNFSLYYDMYDINNCVKISPHIDPNNDYQTKIKNIKNIYGDVVDIDLEIKKHQIAESEKYIKLVGEPVTILPKNNKFGSKVQILHKNKTEGKIYYRGCKFIENNNTKIIENFKLDGSNYSNNFLLVNNFLDCEKEKIYDIVFDNKEYWKENSYEIDFKKLFNNIPDIIQIGLNSFGDKEGYTYIRTNIGLISKYNNTKLYVWTHNLFDGEPYNLNYKLGYYNIEDSGLKSINIKTGFISNGFLELELENEIRLGYLYVYDESDVAFTLLPDRSYRSNLDGTYKDNYNSFWINNYSIGGGENRHNNSENKLYTFTDRILYKPGNGDIFVSGWIRKMGDFQIPKGNIHIELYDPENNIIQSWNDNKLDEFGGFKTKFELNQNSKLGTYMIASKFSDGTQNESYYYNYIKVEEFQKSNIEILSQIQDTEKGLLLNITPQYYFGQNLKGYDIKINYSNNIDGYGIFDRKRCGNNGCEYPIYYNRLDGYSISSGGYVEINNYEKDFFNLKLSDNNYSVSNFNVNIILIDRITKEVVNKYIYEKIMPDYLLGIEGREYNRHDRSMKYKLKGKLLERISSNKNVLENYKKKLGSEVLDIIVYYKSFENQQSLGPDGEYYYNSNGKYEKHKTVQISSTNGEFDTDLDFEKAGNYLLKIKYKSGYENNQFLYVYDNNDQNMFYGNINNNYSLNIFVKDKEYEEGEDIEINFDPYIKGSTAIITIEKNGKILYNKQQVLDGSMIKLKAKKERFPNAHIGIVQIVGEKINNKIDIQREEPRFMIGYKNIQLSPKMMGINFNIKLTDIDGKNKEYFLPGEKVKLKVQSTDYNEKPLQTRISVGIIDKALIDIYDEIRKPLENFYIYSNPGFRIFANYHLLYKALKVFTNDGSKGGGGSKENSFQINPRKKFMDVAFWRGGSITNTDGEIEFETTLPDNLTTWVIDIIGIGKNGEMGTKRQNFITNKDFIINANLPRFINPYSEIIVPISIIDNKNISDKVNITASLELGKHTQDLEIHNDGDEKYLVLSIDSINLEDILTNDNIIININAEKYDSVKYTIPIKKDNMYIKNFVSFDSSNTEETLNLYSKAKIANIKVNVSNLPIANIAKSIKYLLQYPYGCTEQLLSSLYPTLIAKEMYDRGILPDGYISGNMVNYKGNWNSIENIIESTLNIIYKSQKTNGLFGYREGSNEGDLELSSYAYQVFSLIKGLGYNIDLNVFKKLEDNLKGFVNDTSHLNYILQRAISQKNIDIIKAEEILNKNNNLTNKIMLYTIQGYKKINNKKLYEDIKKDLNDLISNNNNNNNNNYYNYNILKSYLIKGLIKNGEIIEAEKFVRELINDTDSNGIWGWSTQTNIQIISAISDFVFTKTKNTQTIKTYITINDRTQQIEIGQISTGSYISNKNLYVNLENISQLKIKTDSNDRVISTFDIKYIPLDINGFHNEGKNVGYLGFKNTTLYDIENMNIGDIKKVIGNFEIENDAKQLAIVYNIPSYTYIINNIGSDQGSDQGSDKSLEFKSTTQTTKRYSCHPDHYEIRYDKLFLYYDNLPKNAGCEITFFIMKTHNGKLDILGHNMFEMYNTNVWYNNYMKK